MSDKNFKLKPTTWPKEYSFEEYRGLNPNINENILINYYNKYLQEYAEDRSRHINHFNDIKDNLSKELLTLKESTGKFNNSSDGDITVGPSGAGRDYHKSLPQDTISLHTDGVDDRIIVSEDNAPFLPGSGLRPYNALTIAAWYRNPYAFADVGAPYYDIIDCYYGGGYILTHYNKRPLFSLTITNGDGTSEFLSVQPAYNVLSPGRRYHTPDDWHLFVATYDCRAVDNRDGTFIGQAKLYIDGVLPTESNTSTGITSHTMDFPNSTGLGTSGSKGSIFYDGEDGNNIGRSKFAPGIGTTAGFDAITGIINSSTSQKSSSIASIALWDKALDEKAIYDLYNSVVSGSSGAQYDLAYGGHPSSFQYDIYDEGLDYTNIGPYAKNLQLWYRLDETVSSSIAVDSSGKGLHGSYHNLPIMSSSYGPGLRGD